MWHKVWRGLEGVARGVGEAGGRGPGCGLDLKAYHGAGRGLEGVARGVVGAGGRGTGCGRG